MTMKKKRKDNIIVVLPLKQDNSEGNVKPLVVGLTDSNTASKEKIWVEATLKTPTTNRSYPFPIFVCSEKKGEKQ